MRQFHPAHLVSEKRTSLAPLYVVLRNAAVTELAPGQHLRLLSSSHRWHQIHLIWRSGFPPFPALRHDRVLIASNCGDLRFVCG